MLLGGTKVNNILPDESEVFDRPSKKINVFFTKSRLKNLVSSQTWCLTKTKLPESILKLRTSSRGTPLKGAGFCWTPWGSLRSLPEPRRLGTWSKLCTDPGPHRKLCGSDAHRQRSPGEQNSWLFLPPIVGRYGHY